MTITREDLKKRLWNIANSRQELKAKMQFYKELIIEMGMSNYALDGMPKGSDLSNPTLAIVINTERYQDEINKAQQELEDNICLFESYLSLLDENESMILRLRYMRGIRWEYMNLNIAYSERQIRRIHNRALDKIINAMT